MAKRYLAKRRTSEDATGLAGWLFTDLLLGLVMIFISAVAFVAYSPRAVGPDGTPLECTDYVAAFIQKPLVIQYKEGEGSDIGTKVNTYINTEQTINGIKQKLTNAKVAVGIVWGWYAPGTSAYGGVTNAKSFYNRFTISDPINFPPLDKNGKVENMRFIGTAGEYADFTKGAGVELFFVYDSCSKQGPASATTTP
jgi:hypothetical protein